MPQKSPTDRRCKSADREHADASVLEWFKRQRLCGSNWKTTGRRAFCERMHRQADVLSLSLPNDQGLWSGGKATIGKFLVRTVGRAGGTQCIVYPSIDRYKERGLTLHKFSAIKCRCRRGSSNVCPMSPTTLSHQAICEGNRRGILCERKGVNTEGTQR